MRPEITTIDINFTNYRHTISFTMLWHTFYFVYLIREHIESIISGYRNQPSHEFFIDCLMFSVGSAAVCSSAVGAIGSYSSGFISQSGRDSVSDSVSTSASAWYVRLAACTHLCKCHIFLLVLNDHSRYKVSEPCVEQVTAVLISKQCM